MKLLIFSKKRTKADGTPFYIYIATLVRKSTGESIPCQVKFKQECGQPNPHTCPRYITVDKKDCNMNKREILTDTNETKTVNTLWVSKWKDGGDYVDTSMDDIDVTE